MAQEHKLMQLGLFVLRSNGIEQNLLDNVLDRIHDEGFKIKLIVPLEWSKDEARIHLKNLYGEKKFEKYGDNIMDLSGHQLVAIVVTDEFPIPAPNDHKPGRFSNWRMNIVKDDVRSKHGNILHCSDTERKAFNEIQSLTELSENNIKKIRDSDEEMVVIEYVGDSKLFSNLNKIKKLGRTVDLWKPPEIDES